MITGEVTPDGSEAILRLVVSSPAGLEREIEAVVDTGFDRYLTLPPQIIRALELPRRGSVRAILADGRVQDVDVYAGSVVWDGVSHNIEIEEAQTDPLVGMELLSGYRLCVECTSGGRVEIKKLLTRTK